MKSGIQQKHIRRFIKQGDRFSRLVILGPSFNKKGKKYWECLCDCGNIKSINTHSIVTGEIKSCGCLYKERIARRTLIRLMQASKPRKTELSRFEEKYIPVTESGCWIWIGANKPDGYGQIFYKGKCQTAHRVSWQLHKGEIPPNLGVLHHCDTPACVNPSHLFLGTVKDNMQDCVKKGRRPRRYGDLIGTAKLSNKDIAHIRQDKRIARDIALDFNVSRSTISHIKNNRSWRNI